MQNTDAQLVINDKRIGVGHPTYFIADIAANHDGSLDRAKQLIFKAAQSGANAAKFQHFNAETIVSDVGFRALGKPKSHQAKWEKSVFEVYKDASVSLDWTPELKATCESAGIDFFTSPYDFSLVDHIDPFVPAYKIGSGDITWLEMIQYIAGKQKPYILATGASSLQDVQQAVEAGLAVNQQLALLQCNTNYTGSLENFRYINLTVLHTYRSMFPQLVLGLSDHTRGHATVLGAVALGARIIEKHFTDDISRQGPDHGFSMDPAAWQEMVSCTRELENALGNGNKLIEQNEIDTAILQRRAIRVVHDIAAGSVLQRKDLTVLRPCPLDAISPSDLTGLLGRTLRTKKQTGEYLRWTDLE
jgi:sialic acid synthase SpsE